MSAGGSSDNGETATQTPATKFNHQREQAKRRAADRRAALRLQARIKARQAHRAQLAARRRRQARERQAKAEETEAIATEEEAASEAAGSGCDSNYSGACLDPYSSDYDCDGGSGDGPDYTGTVTVVGEDHYGLDANANGVGCEPE